MSIMVSTSNQMLDLLRKKHMEFIIISEREVILFVKLVMMLHVPLSQFICFLIYRIQS